MTEKLSQGLWDFALSFYTEERKALLLKLQDEAGMDVLLAIAYFWARECQLGWVSAQELEAYSRWRQEIIVPLRTVRRRLSKDQPLRAQLLNAELSAERTGLELLEALAWQAPWPESVLAENFMYFQYQSTLPQLALPLWQQLLRQH